MTDTSFSVRSPNPAKKVAKALKSALSARGVQIAHHTCLDLVAKMYGFADWHALEKSARSDAPASYDSDVGTDTAAARRDRHVRVLTDVGVDPKIAADVVVQIRPTAKPGAPLPPLSDDEFFAAAEDLMRSAFGRFADKMIDTAIIGRRGTRDVGVERLSSARDARHEPMRLRRLMQNNHMDRYLVFYQAVLEGSATAKAAMAGGHVALDEAYATRDDASDRAPGELLAESKTGKHKFITEGLPERAMVLVGYSQSGATFRRIYEIRRGKNGNLELCGQIPLTIESDFDNLFGRSFLASPIGDDFRLVPSDYSPPGR